MIKRTGRAILPNPSNNQLKSRIMNDIKEIAYQLMVMLSTIMDEMERGGDAPTLEEMTLLSDHASELYNELERL